MKKIEAIVRPAKLEPLKEAFLRADVKGLTISEVHGCGNQRGWKEYYRGSEVIINMLPKIKFEVVVSDAKVKETVELIIATAKTDQVGDGKIFVLPVEEVIRIRTGEAGEIAI
ncbi:MAG: P-II family nitrogen regulator [Coriobacteriales bacterium]|jgi:nitrogen regulatory protein P-II 1|nr:P-II family nitrogen regulator [Coriobacteriales bacterium]